MKKVTIHSLKVKKPKTIAKLKAELQVHFNKFIRSRDIQHDEFICIACNKKWPAKSCQAGHFFGVKQFNHMRFLETNVHGECQHCNGFNHESLIGYTLNIQNKISKEEFEHLLELSKTKQPEFTREYLNKMIDIYKNKR